MRKFIKNIIVALSIFTLCIGCDEQLDLSDPTAFSEEDLLNLDNGFFLLANGVLDAYQKVVSNEYLINEQRSDNTVSNTLAGNIANINSYNITATEGNVADYYSNNMQTIAKANLIIENRFLAPEEFQYTVGEAFFLRALCHFNLVRSFLNVPYIDEVLDVSEGDIQNFPQLNPSEVYSRIAEDFNTSIAFLASSPTSTSKRPNSNAAIALLAKTLLSQPEPNYTEARLLLSSLISSGDHSLIFTELAAATDFDGDGVITTLEHNATLAQNFASVFGNTITGDVSIGPTGNLMGDGWVNSDDLEDNDEVLFQIDFEEAGSIDDDDIASADTDLNDQVETDAEEFSFDMSPGGQSNGVNTASLDFLGVMNIADQPVRFDGTLVAASFNLIRGLDTETFNNKYPVGSNRGNGNDWVIMRYADVLLLFVEAVIGDADFTTDQSAIDAFNLVRARAGLEELEAGDQLTKQALLEERRVEFAYENQRLYDLIRFDVANEVLSVFSDASLLNYVPLREFLPIPQREIDATGGLYDQNSGY